MSPAFDAYVIVDWSAAGAPRTGADSIWIACVERAGATLERPLLLNPPTRYAAAGDLRELFAGLIARGRRVLAGFDFAFGYPTGFAARLGSPEASWRVVWHMLAQRVRDGAGNVSNRFEVAAELNRLISGTAFPFWGCPATCVGPGLLATRPAGYAATADAGLTEFRLTEARAAGPQPTWKLAYAGSVGSQTMLGIACLERLRREPSLAGRLRVWPFETGLALPDAAGADAKAGAGEVVLAEVYPSMLPLQRTKAEVRDRAQVRTLALHFAGLDGEDALAPLFAGPPDLTTEQRRRIEREEGWILGIERAALRRRRASLPDAAERPPGEPRYDYLRDPEEIYRRSFATIRAEADLAAVPEALRPVAIRLIHAAGDVGLVRDLRWGGSVAAAARQAFDAGAPILVDATMVAAGIIRARLPAGNQVICTLTDTVRAEGTTRSAAAVDLWRDRLAGAIVAIGNAPTALFRLLELLDAGAPRPAAILGFPVGFVGAAESKEALIAHPAGVPFITLRGRRGGSALAAAAVNALAHEPGAGEPA